MLLFLSHKLLANKDEELFSPNNEPEIHKNVKNFLARLQFGLNLSDNELADYMGYRLVDFEQHVRKTFDISINHLARLAESFNVGVENIIQGTADVSQLIKRFQGDVYCLPERYQIFSKSKMEVARYTLGFIEDSFGVDTKQMVMRQLQLSDQLIFSDCHEINLLLAVDICERIAKLPHGQEMLMQMGRNFHERNKEQQWANAVREIEKYGELYSFFSEVVVPNYVEKNFKWQVQKVENGSLIITGTPEVELLEMLGKENVCKKSMAHLRAGFLSSVAQFAGQDPLWAELLYSTADGYDCEAYRIHFSGDVKFRKNIM